LAPAIAVSPSVTKILVGGNRLRDEGTIILCDALRESTVSKVEELSLYDNGIGPDGAKAIAALCIVCAPSLTSVR
jgi:Ran GTPase-activating protein (RanGAP) involved in mRNA processing and transport